MSAKQTHHQPVSTDTASFRQAAWRKGRTLLLFAAVLIGLYLVGVLLMSLLSLDRLHSIKLGLRTFGEWWVIVRLSFIAGLTFYWVEINVWLSQRNGWSEAHLARVVAGRWLMLGLLSFVELFLVQRIHQPLIDRWIG